MAIKLTMESNENISPQASGSPLTATKMRIAAAMMALGVALGAYGAHGLQTDEKGLANWETAVLYHLIHGLGLLLLASRFPKSNGPWWCLFAGTLLFSGLLYAIVLTGVTVLGALVPIGGTLFLIGWTWFAARPQ